jgi:hypothetical protein
MNPYYLAADMSDRQFCLLLAARFFVGVTRDGAYSLRCPASPSFPLPRAGLCHHIIIELYYEITESKIFGNADIGLLDYNASHAATEHFSQLYT